MDNLNKNTYYYTDVVQSFMNKVYCWMSFGLMITSFVSYYIYNCNNLLYFIYSNNIIIILLLLSQFLIVFILSNMLNNLSENMTIFLFLFYSILTGINFSSLFLIYTNSSIFISFFITSIMFMFMTLYGYFTNNDLTNFNSLFLMLLFGISLSSIINIYFNNEYLIWLISYFSIITFTGLIAYDTQKLKNLGNKLYYLDNNVINKYSILGALILYLDFINLFLIPLRYLKKNKNK